jgi:ferrous iron transport protein A
MKNNSQLTMSDLGTGKQGIILSFLNAQSINNRLASLGFTPGAEVAMTQNFGRGPLIVTVRGARVALGRGEAQKIIVELRG